MTKFKPTHRHKQRGSLEQVIGHASLQNATNRVLKEADDLVIYRDAEGRWWARHVDEFNDGRFENYWRGNKRGRHDHFTPEEIERIKQGYIKRETVAAVAVELGASHRNVEKHYGFFRAEGIQQQEKK